MTVLNREIETCRICPRLVAYREEVGRVRRRAFLHQEYWSRPLTGFGDPNARVIVVGLAPAAHGGNRTGRVFTGDRSADFLIRAMWETGYANQSTSLSKDDGLILRDVYVTLPVRCAPPDNKPLPTETLNCRPYFVRELALLQEARVIVALGHIALNAYLAVLQEAGLVRSRSLFSFSHGASFSTHAGGPHLVTSYHPSQQNTSTGRLTAEMLRNIFERARDLSVVS